MDPPFLSDLSKLPEQDELMSGYIKMLKKNENDCEIWVNLGVILARNRNYYKQSIECFSKALEICPKRIDAWNDKGRTLYNMQKYQDAITLL